MITKTPPITTVTKNRSVNWLESTSRALTAAFPGIDADDCVYLTERLCVVLLERLPPHVSTSLLGLLPEPSQLRPRQFEKLLIAARKPPDYSIGYPALVEEAARSVHEPRDPRDLQEMTEPGFFERVTDYVLWAFAVEIPTELKVKLSDNLPSDIRNRMNLYSGHSEDAKVA
jgi:hypothetical protein